MVASPSMNRLTVCAAMLAMSTAWVGCSGGEAPESVELSGEGLQYEQRLDQAGKCMAARGPILAITDLDYIDCDDSPTDS